MIIGHYGVGFALKKASPALSLATLFIAVQFVDILWTILVFLGIERVNIVPGYLESSQLQFTYYPFTHSLLATLIYGALAFALVYLARKGRLDRVLTAVVISVGVISHFILDLLVHVPDLTLAGPGTPAVGLGLWHSLPLSLFLEISFLAAGIFIYYRTTRGRGFWSGIGPLLLGLFLTISQVMSELGPPPPDKKALVVVGFVTYLVIAGIAYWIDRNRLPRVGVDFVSVKKPLAQTGG